MNTHEIINLDLSNFEDIFKKYYNMLCVVAYEYVRDRGIAEDIVEDVFTNIWNKRESIVFESSAKNYLMRSVKNQCLQHLRGQKMRFYSIDITAEQWHIPWSDSYPLGSVILQEFESAAQEGINSLPPVCKQIYTLSRNEGLSYKEIAQKLNISENTVKFHMKTAMLKLRKHLAEYISMLLF